MDSGGAPVIVDAMEHGSSSSAPSTATGKKKIEVKNTDKRLATATGRKKIKIKKIENMNALHVAFSKRRTGLFRKAQKICDKIGGVVAATVVFSPGNKTFEWGSPSVDEVIDRYLQQYDDQGKWWWEEVKTEEMGLEDLQGLKQLLMEEKPNIAVLEA